MNRDMLRGRSGTAPLLCTIKNKSGVFGMSQPPNLATGWASPQPHGPCSVVIGESRWPYHSRRPVLPRWRWPTERRYSSSYLAESGVHFVVPSQHSFYIA